MDQSNNKMIVPASIILAGVLIAGAIIYNTGAKSLAPTPANTNNPPTPAAPLATPTIGSDVVLGDPNAPVTIIEWGDFQCPFCAQFYTQVEKPLREEYIKAGKVKMVFRDFPLSFHPAANPAANAAECAKDQNKYWLYHDALFDRQNTIESLDFIKLAGDLGLNTTTFKKCYDSKKYQSEIDADTAEGTAVGVEGTPTSFINGTIISGAQPYAAVKAAIEAALAKK